MEKRLPFFLDKLFRRNPETSESNEDNGWGNTTNDTNLNGWGSFPGSRAITNGWVDELPEKQYNGWGSGSSGLPTTPKTSSNGWAYEHPKDEYNGWGSGSGSSGLPTTPKASSNGWAYEHPKDEYNGWGSGSSGIPTTPKASSNGWVHKHPKDECNGWGSGLGLGTGTGTDDKRSTSRAIGNGWTDEVHKDKNNEWGVPETKPVNAIQQTETDAGPIVEVDSWALPSAPPLPEEGFSEDSTANLSYHPSVDFPIPAFSEAVVTNEGKHGDAPGSSCVVCWEAPVEGACVPCGHMAGCMLCLHEIESKQGTCPVCRTKIDKVMRIYTI